MSLVDTLPRVAPSRRVENQEILPRTSDSSLASTDPLSDYFDPDWYCQQYPDVEQSGYDPLDHYRNLGFKEGRWPVADFDPFFYLTTYLNGHWQVEPFAHYIATGRAEHYAPNRIEYMRNRSASA